MNKRFGFLSQKTIEMIEDVGTYQLEEEANGSYKTISYHVPPRLLKK